MDNNPKGMSCEDVVRGMLQLYRMAEAEKRWGELNYVVTFKDGQPKHIRRSFTETLTQVPNK